MTKRKLEVGSPRANEEENVDSQEAKRRRESAPQEANLTKNIKIVENVSSEQLKEYSEEQQVQQQKESNNTKFWLPSQTFTNLGNRLVASTESYIGSNVSFFKLPFNYVLTQQLTPGLCVNHHTRAMCKEVLERSKKTPRSRAVIYGNEMLGTALPLEYLLKLLVQERKTIIVHNLDTYKYEPDGDNSYVCHVWEYLDENEDPFTRVKDCVELQNSDVYFLVLANGIESCTFHGNTYAAHTIVSNSLNAAYAYEFTEGTANVERYFIPAWELSELKAMNTLIGMDSERLEVNYKIFGGLPELVFSNAYKYFVLRFIHCELYSRSDQLASIVNSNSLHHIASKGVDLLFVYKLNECSGSSNEAPTSYQIQSQKQNYRIEVVSDIAACSFIYNQSDMNCMGKLGQQIICRVEACSAICNVPEENNDLIAAAKEFMGYCIPNIKNVFY